MYAIRSYYEARAMALNPKIRDWRDRRVWIVGGSTGIGAATAERLLAAGARVAVSARGAETLEARFARHAECLRLPADVLDTATLESSRAAIVARWGGLRITSYNVCYTKLLRVSRSTAAIDIR